MARARGRIADDRTPGGGAGRVRPLRRRVCGMLGGLAAGAGLLVVLQFAVGRVLTDSTYATQYLWWIPALGSAGAAWGLLVLSAVLGRCSRGMRGVMARPLLLAACVAMTLWIAFGEWNAHRFVLPRRAAPDGVRVLHWNLSSTKIRDGGYWTRLQGEDPDIVLIANPRFGSDLREVLRAQSWLAPSEDLFAAAPRYKLQGAPGHFLISHRGLIASRYPILRAGVVSTGPMVNPDNEARSTGEHGWVLFAEFDLGEGRDPLVVWFVDLPSDPLAWRMETMRSIREAVAGWNGAVQTPTETGWQWAPGGGTFPEPDLVIGDCNALRGSASLGVLAPGYRDAFELAGRGSGRSWAPLVRNRVLRQGVKLSSWHIDLSLVGPGWDAAGYRLIDPGRGPHRVQVVDLVSDNK